MIKTNMILPMVSKVIEVRTGTEVVIDYEMYEFLRTNELGFNTLYKGIPLNIESLGLKPLKYLTDNVLSFIPKTQAEQFINQVTRYGENVYFTSVYDVDYGFYPHWEKDTMFFGFWYTDAGDSSNDYIPHSITEIKYQHQAEYLLSFYRSIDYFSQFKEKPKYIIPNEE